MNCACVAVWLSAGTQSRGGSVLGMLKCWERSFLVVSVPSPRDERNMGSVHC